MSPHEVMIRNTEQHEFDSGHIDDRFQLSVMLPGRYANEPDTAYPTVYVLDGNAMFELAVGVIRGLQRGGELPDMLVVGVGYPVGSMKVVAKRTRDFTHTVDLGARASYGDEPGLPDEIESGGAARFLAALRDEVIPFVESRYRCDGDRTIVGFSLGGLFGLFALFDRPADFGRYVIGSPSIWWTGRSILDNEAAYAADHSDLPARVFLSVGSDEEPPADADPPPSSTAERERFELMVEARMTSNVRELDATLRNRGYDGLELTTHIFDGESHSSVAPATFSRGLRTVFSML